MYRRSKVTKYPQKTKISIPRKRVHFNKKDAKRNPKVEEIYSQYPETVKGNLDIRISLRLGNLNIDETESTEKIKEICKGSISQEKITEIAWAISNELNIFLDRDVYRRYIVLFIWFNENWEQIKPIIDNVRFDVNGKVQISKPEFVSDFDPFQDNSFENQSFINDLISPYENNDNNDFI